MNCSTPCPISWAGCEISQGKRMFFPRVLPDLPWRPPIDFRTSPSNAGLSDRHRPCIRFLFVMTRFRLRLPSDPASRQTPWPQLAVPTDSARRGLSPPRTSACLAHTEKAKESPSLASLFYLCACEVSCRARAHRPVASSVATSPLDHNDQSVGSPAPPHNRRIQLRQDCITLAGEM